MELLRPFVGLAETGRPLDPGLRLQLATAAPLPHDAPAPGIGAGLERILTAPFAPLALAELAYTGWAAACLPELIPCLGYPGDGEFHAHPLFEHLMEVVRLTPPRPAVRWAALFHDVGKPWTRTGERGRYHFYGHDSLSAEMFLAAAARLQLAPEVSEAAAKLIRRHMFGFEMTPKGMRRLHRQMGEEGLRDLLALKLADMVGTGGRYVAEAVAAYWQFRAQLDDALRQAPAFTVRDLAINGNDVMAALGIPPGPAVGDILQELFERVKANPALNERERLLALVATRFRPAPG